MPGFISWAEWQIQYNASLRSEHFTVGPSMWPWFRWMSTSHLYSSNQQSLTETHAHTQLHWLSLTLSLSSALSASSAHYAAETSDRKKRETPDTREIYSQTSLFTPQSESQRSWHQRVMLAHPVPSSLCQGGLERKAPVLQTSRTPQHPAHAISRFKLCLLKQKFKYTICNNSDIKDERRGLD